MDKKSLTLRGINGILIFHLVTSILVIFTSYINLQHFFSANFPSSIYAGSFCDFSAFFNCDNSAFSFISHVLGVPLGYFGMAVGLASLMGILFPSIIWDSMYILALAGLLSFSLTMEQINWHNWQPVHTSAFINIFV